MVKVAELGEIMLVIIIVIGVDRPEDIEIVSQFILEKMRSQKNKDQII